MKRKGQWFTARTVAAVLLSFMVVGALVLVFPTAYPHGLMWMLENVSPLLDEDLSLHAFTMEGTEGQFDIKTGYLHRFHDVQGQPFPVIIMDYSFDLGVYNTYPLIVFTVLASIPLALRRRLILVALGFAGIFVVGLIDLVIIWNWMGLEGISNVISHGGFQIPTTGANLAVSEEITKSIERVTLAKSFLSTGGRQFLSMLVVGLCLLVVFPRSKGSD